MQIAVTLENLNSGADLLDAEAGQLLAARSETTAAVQRALSESIVVGAGSIEGAGRVVTDSLDRSIEFLKSEATSLRLHALRMWVTEKYGALLVMGTLNALGLGGILEDEETPHVTDSTTGTVNVEIHGAFFQGSGEVSYSMQTLSNGRVKIVVIHKVAGGVGAYGGAKAKGGSKKLAADVDAQADLEVMVEEVYEAKDRDAADEMLKLVLIKDLAESNPLAKPLVMLAERVVDLPHPASTTYSVGVNASASGTGMIPKELLHRLPKKVQAALKGAEVELAGGSRISVDFDAETIKVTGQLKGSGKVTVALPDKLKKHLEKFGVEGGAAKGSLGATTEMTFDFDGDMTGRTIEVEAVVSAKVAGKWGWGPLDPKGQFMNALKGAGGQDVVIKVKLEPPTRANGDWTLAVAPTSAADLAATKVTLEVFELGKTDYTIDAKIGAGAKLGIEGGGVMEVRTLLHRTSGFVDGRELATMSPLERAEAIADAIERTVGPHLSDLQADLAAHNHPNAVTSPGPDGQRPGSVQTTGAGGRPIDSNGPGSGSIDHPGASATTGRPTDDSRPGSGVGTAVGSVTGGVGTGAGGSGPAAGPATAVGSATHGHRVRAGENLWSISAEHLAATLGVPVSNLSTVAIAEYWERVVSGNAAHLRSGDVDRIYPGEVIVLPPIGR